ncbi:MAG: hypothetical protein D6738_10645 [Acidobacteria bacterium]|nr:MAG: hypothetical protein D6738_10645 [Acidobacteriota bacterium]
MISVEYSPDASFVIAHHLVASGKAISLLDDAGDVRWTKLDDEGSYFFSSTGEAVFAWAAGDEYSGETVAVFSLTGDYLGRLKVGARVDAALALGPGSTVVVASRHSLTMYDLGAEERVLWRRVLDTRYPPVSELLPAGGGRILVRMQGGWALLLDGSGNSLFSYEPPSLAANDPERDADDYMRFKACPLNPALGIMFFDGTDEALQLVGPPWSLVERRINASGPPGFSTPDCVQDDRLVFLGGGEVRIRLVE